MLRMVQKSCGPRTQPGSARSGPARPGSARSGAARPGSARCRLRMLRSPECPPWDRMSALGRGAVGTAPRFAVRCRGRARGNGSALWPPDALSPVAATADGRLSRAVPSVRRDVGERPARSGAVPAAGAGAGAVHGGTTPHRASGIGHRASGIGARIPTTMARVRRAVSDGARPETVQSRHAAEIGQGRMPSSVASSSSAP